MGRAGSQVPVHMVPFGQMPFPLLHSSPSSRTGRQTPQSFWLYAPHARVSHCVLKAHADPSFIVPGSYSHSGYEPRLMSSQSASRYAWAQRATASMLTREPAENSKSGQSGRPTAMHVASDSVSPQDARRSHCATMYSAHAAYWAASTLWPALPPSPGAPASPFPSVTGLRPPLVLAPPSPIPPVPPDSPASPV